MSALEQPIAQSSPQTLSLKTPAGHKISLRVFAAEQPRSVVVIASAMGIAQRYYEKFARYLCSQGFTTITFDYFGTGTSLETPLKDCDTSVMDWATEDCNTVIDFARMEYPDLKLQWIGHSVGGQLLGMTPRVNELDNIVTVACGSGYWLKNSPPTKRVAWLLWYVLAPVTVPVLGYFPGDRLNMVGDLPANVMRQWRRWCLNPEYAVGAEGAVVRDQFASVTVPITSIAFTDDEMMSRHNVESLHSFYSSAPVTLKRIAPRDIGEKHIGHLGWFRERYRESIWTGQVLPLLN